jgi:hypothetical protein
VVSGRYACPAFMGEQTSVPSGHLAFMNTHLAALVRRVAELCRARLKVCHCIEEFPLQRIRPFSCRDKYAYECLRMADHSREPTNGKLSTLSFKCRCRNYSILTFSLSCIALSQEDVNRFVTQFFDKDPPTVRPPDLPLPYSTEKLSSFDKGNYLFFIITQSVINI